MTLSITEINRYRFTGFIVEFLPVNFINYNPSMFLNQNHTGEMSFIFITSFDGDMKESKL